MTVPTFQMDVTVWTLAGALAIIGVGYAVHELAHILPLWLSGAEWSARLFPTDRPWYLDATVGQMVEIRHTAGPRVALMSLLAPGLLALPGLWAWGTALLQPTASVAELTLIGAWVAVFLPSAKDWIGVWTVLAVEEYKDGMEA